MKYDPYVNRYISLEDYIKECYGGLPNESMLEEQYNALPDHPGDQSKFMQIEFNNQNFAYAKFEDRYKQKCSIQKSSIATEDCIWLGVDVGIPVELGGTGDEIMGRMHLTQDMAAELIPILQRFVETGEIYKI
jgi:hypothetical protein